MIPQETSRWLVPAGLACAISVAWMILWVPPNMSEVTPFHRLACQYSQAQFHVFRAGCNLYRLDFGPLGYYRPFAYVGATSGILYWPIWSVWRSIYSYYLMGVIVLGVFSFCFVKALALDRRYAIIPLGWFPVTYSVIHDTGPVRLALLSFPLLAIMMRWLLSAPDTKWKNAIAFAAGLLVVICIEDKPFYIYLLPGLAFFIAACTVVSHSPREIAESLRKNKFYLSFFLLVVLAGSTALLLGGQTEDGSYLEELMRAADLDLLMQAAENRLSPAEQALTILTFTFSFPAYAHKVFFPTSVFKVFEVQQASGIIFGCAVAAALVLMAVCALRRNAGNWAAIILLIGSFCATVLVFLVIGNPWAGHHYVFLQLPILAGVLLFAGSRSGRFTSVLGFLILTNIAAVTVLMLSPIAPESARERASLFNYLSRTDVASRNVINFSSWGGYRLQALYGDDSQLVTYIEPFERSDAEKLMDLGRATSRNLINVCLKHCEPDNMRTLFDPQRVTEIDLGLRYWRLYQISLE